MSVPVDAVGFVTSPAFLLDQDSEQFLRPPALRPRRHAELGGELTDAAQLQPLQSLQQLTVQALLDGLDAAHAGHR